MRSQAARRAVNAQTTLTTIAPLWLTRGMGLARAVAFSFTIVLAVPHLSAAAVTPARVRAVLARIGLERPLKVVVLPRIDG